MKKITIAIILLSICFPSYVLAKDTDLYVLDAVIDDIQPDILLILDLSYSMRWPTYETFYVADATKCNGSTTSGGKTVNKGPYYLTSGTGHTYACKVSDNGDFDSTKIWYSDSTCSGGADGIFYFNDNSHAGYTTPCRRVDIAKIAVKQVLDYDKSGTVNCTDENGLKFLIGYEQFIDSGPSNCSKSGTTINCPSITFPVDIPKDCPTPPTSNCTYVCGKTGSPPAECQDYTKLGYAKISTAVNSISSPNGNTPVVFALEKALTYLNSSKAADTCAKDCRKKFVILMTDGDDTLACPVATGASYQSDQYKRRRETVARAKALADAGYKVFVIGIGSGMPYYLVNTLNWAAWYGQTDNPGDANSGSVTDYLIQSGSSYLFPSGITSCQSDGTAGGGSPANTGNVRCYVWTDYIKSPQVLTKCDGASGRPAVGANGCYCFAVANDPGQKTLNGYAYFASDADQLANVLMGIRDYIGELCAEDTSYVAPVVPISQFESTKSQNRIYLGMFKPTLKGMWNGNIKKYGIATGTEGVSVGTIIDMNNLPVMTTGSEIVDGAQSYWGTTPDKGDVTLGGVGAVLQAGNLDSRSIYTYFRTSTDLKNSSNEFSLSNTSPDYSTGKISTATLGVATTLERDDIIKFIRGWDVWDWNLNSDYNETRDWILGGIIHSRPYIINYGSQTNKKSVIYVGANDGMLHAFDNGTVGTSAEGTGEELWAFIPQELLPGLKNFKTATTPQFFVDGSPKAYIETDASGAVTKAILIFGLRRGGNYYYALNVSDPLAPEFLWAIGPNEIVTGTTTTSPATDYQELGQTWSAPRICKIKDSDTVTYPNGRWVAIFGGGYDDTAGHEDDPNWTGTDTKGKAVYIVDVNTGALVWKYTAGMTKCIPSDVTTLDTDGDGYVDRLYVGDLGGNMWRFDIGDPSARSGRIIFSGTGKIFYPPDVTYESDTAGDYSMLFFGTGDREAPKNTTFVNRLYAIKDRNLSSSIILNETRTDYPLVDVTTDVLQDPTSTQSQKETTLNNLKSGYGWFIKLTDAGSPVGEKSLASPVVFAGAVFYTTFTPTPVDNNDLCALKEGTGKVYILKYLTGNAVFNLDLSSDNQVTGTDRSEDIGGGIPSGIIIAISITNESVTAYGGIGGGVFSPELPQARSIIPVNWEIVF